MSKRLLIIGDLIIDETYHVEVNRISPEAPIPTAELLDAEPTRSAGGAGFAAAWAASHDIDTTLICAANGVDIPNVNLLPIEKLKKNVTKTRFIDKTHGYHLLRLDNDKVACKPTITPTGLIEFVDKYLEGNQVDAVVLSDYCKGFFNPEHNWGKAITYLNSRVHTVLLDTRSSNLDCFMIKGNYNTLVPCFVKMNLKESSNVAKRYEKEFQDVLPNHIITMGDKGAYLYVERSGIVPHVRKAEPTVKVYSSSPDTTGCGDIFDVTLAIELSTLDFDQREHECSDEENFWINGSHIALQKAVNVASYYANIPFKEKLCSPMPKDLML